MKGRKEPEPEPTLIPALPAIDALHKLHNNITDHKNVSGKNASRINSQFHSLISELIELHNELVGMKEKCSSSDSGTYSDITTLASAAGTLLDHLSDAANTDDSKKAEIAIQAFSHTACGLDSFKKSSWTNLGKKVAQVLIVAACCALGAAAGVFIFGFTVAAITAPPTAGIAAIFAGIPAAIAGGAIGASIGLTCGLVASGAGGFSIGALAGLFGTWNLSKTRHSRIVDAAKAVAATLPTSSSHPHSA